MAELTANQIIERIANANGVEPAVMRQQMEQALRNTIADTTQPHLRTQSKNRRHGGIL